MAGTYRFYRSPRIGSGASTHDAFRSDLSRFIPGADPTAVFWDWINDARAVRYALAFCDSTVHAAIDVDGTSLALSGELVDLAAVADELDNHTGLNLPAGVQSQFEADGISLAWLASQTTRRQLWNYASRLHVIFQDVKRVANSDTLSAFGQALSLRTNQLSAQVRTKVATWMQNKGLDTTWITGTTTVRQVLQYVIENINWPTLTLGPVSF